MRDIYQPILINLSPHTNSHSWHSPDSKSSSQIAPACQLYRMLLLH